MAIESKIRIGFFIFISLPKRFHKFKHYRSEIIHKILIKLGFAL